MTIPFRNSAFPYGTATAAAAGAVLVCDLEEFGPPRSDYLLLLSIVAIAAWLWGTGPGAAALGMGGLLALAATLNPRNIGGLPGREELESAGLFAFTGGTLLAAMAWLRRAENRVRAEREKLAQAVIDLRKQSDLQSATLKRVEGVVKQAYSRRNEFLAMMAHELRNPLAPVRTALYVLRQPNTNAGVTAKLLDMMDRQLGHMTHIVNDLVDITRLYGGKVELRKETVRLDVVVQRALGLLQPLIEDRCLEITVSLPEDPLLLDVDPARLEQVLVNLLHNAVKYTDPGGRVALLAAAAGGQVKIHVRDSGIGIAPEMLPDIFDLFVQMERRLYRSQGGLGIGLTLVRNLVELHGGMIEAQSAGLGQGSEFVVTLPMHQEPSIPHPPANTRKERDAMNPGRKLIVVDDNVDAADSLAMLLRLEGHEVRVAHDGPTALKIAQAERPDLILLDLGMPGMDGYQVARRIRRTPGLHDVFLVALTGWGQDEDQRRSREAGFDLHYIKPIEPQALKDLLDQPPPQPRPQATMAAS